MANQTVLIVDDEEEIRELIRKYLEREGIRSIECETGKQALVMMENHKVDLVILDIMMKDMDGFEVITKLRAFDRTVSVIFLSARQEEYDIVLGLGLGADDYVTKPFSPGEFMARVKAHLRRKSIPDQEKMQVLVYKELSMDLSTYTVTKADKSVDLSGKEFRLLQFFMENPKRVFTKAQIYHQVWDPDFEDDNTVMVYISHLRDKIEDSSEKQELIQTIRGIGYRFG
ncbi:MAG: response regulator transcription factor [Clostridiales bacterium]|nr:response regulator transcription factor [Clostridiales bacterium]